MVICFLKILHRGWPKVNVQEELRINGYQPTVGYPGTDMGDFFKGVNG